MTTTNSAALAAVLTLALTGTALAAPATDSLRIPVGDLSTPAAAHALDQRIQIAAARLCEPSYALGDLGGWSFCLSSVRASAMRQLTPDQQVAYATALRTTVHMASR